MPLNQLREYWISDAYRYTGNKSWKSVLKLLLYTAGYKHTFWMRLCSYLLSKPKYCRPLYYLCRLNLHRYSVKYGIEILPRTKVGIGLEISHFGTIVVNSNAVIGKNLTISHGVTIGSKANGMYKGYPHIGDNVYIAPGAKIIGAVKVGNNVVIGANCVVTKDVPDNAVVVGIPGRVISYAGSDDYVTRKYKEA